MVPILFISACKLKLTHWNLCRYHPYVGSIFTSNTWLCLPSCLPRTFTKWIHSQINYPNLFQIMIFNYSQLFFDLYSLKYTVVVNKSLINLSICWMYLPLSLGLRMCPERLERGGPCWLLKLREIGTQRGQMKGVLTWLVRWAYRAGTRDFCSALAALVGPVQNIFSHHTFFPFLCPHRPASWVASLLECISGFVIWSIGRICAFHFRGDRFP